MKGLLFLLLITVSAAAQESSLEILQQELENVKSVNDRIDLLNKLAHAYSQISLETAEQFAHEALESAMEIDYQKGIASSFNNLGICNSIRGDYPVGLDYFIKALRIREREKDLMGTSHTLNNISRLFIYQNDFDKALEYSTKSLEILKQVQDHRGIGNAHISLGSIYLSKNNVQEAIRMFSIAKDHFVKQRLKDHEGWALLKIANAYQADGRYDRALQSCFAAMDLLDPRRDLFSSIELNQTIGLIYSAKDDLASSIRYLKKAIQLSDQGHDGQGSMTSRQKLAEVFKKFKYYDSALYYNEAYLRLYQETFSADKARQLATLEKIYQTEKKDQLLELKNQQIESQSIIITSISFLLAALTVLGVIIFRYTRDKRKSNIKLKQLNREIQEKHEEILAQSEELTQANQEISRINENLEQEVNLRTEKIERQNRMLIEYAYSNAHNVRGPLARILGLASLMSWEDDPELLKEYTTFMYVSAQELDNVIREINIKLQNEST